MIVGVAPKAHVRTTLTRHPVAPRRARLWARSALCSWSATEQISAATVDDVVLVLSELVSNSLLHARGPIRARLALLRAGEVQVEVHDGGPASSRTRRPDQDDGVYGRGLAITSTVASRCGWTRQPGGTTAWATVLTTAAAA
ncbi:ATP-binding protein [Streptomyces sp. NPDC004031]